MNNKLRVWWMPQIGATGETFHIPVQSVEEGKKVMDILSAYDAFQLQNRIKPDYANAGGLQVYNPETADWEDWYLATEEDFFEAVDEYISSTDNAEMIDNFTHELFAQIDWDKIEQMTR